jgi:hypothetical protein
MREVLLVRAKGLSPDQACRGDLAANISDLIADGSFAELSGPLDLSKDLGGLPGELRVVDFPGSDVPAFDRELGRLRSEAPDASVAIVSEAVFISQHFFPQLKPGMKVSPSDVPGLLAAIPR